MARKIPLIAIVGRTNVGKSTLFNQIVGRRLSIVDDHHGVTRDRNYAFVKKYLRPFTLVDTGGIVGEEDSSVQEAVREQTELAIQEADLILAVLDGHDGPHPYDSIVVERLRKSKTPVLWVVNKSEKPSTQQNATEFYQLGLEDFICVSAAHNVGIGTVVESFWELLPEHFQGESGPEEESSAIRVAIVGKPNAGKSTFVNTLLGDERLVTSPEAGTTRDRVHIPLTRDGQDFLVTDTAGLRKKARIKERTVERYSNLRALAELAECDVAVLLIDATQGPPSEQDAKIAGLIHERGRAFVIVVNKWDAIEKDHKTAKEFKEQVFDVFKFARYAPVLFISALTGKRCPSVLKNAKEVYEASKLRIQTSEINKVFERAFIKFHPPVYRGEPVKFFFGTQVDVCPPTFVLFLNHPGKINFSYQRYLRNALRKEYPFQGSDVRLHLRKRSSKEDKRKSAANG